MRALAWALQVGPSPGQAPEGHGWEFSALKGLLCEQTMPKGLEVGARVGVLTRIGIWEGGRKNIT